MKAQVVIGACWGDEGKGLVTDYLCAPHGEKAIVVRFCGGSQAGHTVVTENKRHVFSHFGSGSLAGAATHLSQFFIVNPLLWRKELNELGFRPRLSVHPLALVTTPYDMLLNQEIETARGAKRHGSCGAGINETLQRSIPLRAGMLRRAKSVKDTALTIRKRSLGRLEELNLKPSEWFLERLHSRRMLKSFLDACAEFSAYPLRDNDIVWDWSNVIFEGAQGLLLDQRHPFFPHVTHANTGLKNVVEIAGFAELEVFYVMRTYLTRHGAGPFPTEDPNLKFEDDTNSVNPWQGALRFGPLDVPLIADAINRDLEHLESASAASRAYLAVTHCDQHTEKATEELSNCVGLSIALKSHGSGREHVTSLLERACPHGIIDKLCMTCGNSVTVINWEHMLK